MSTVRHFHNYEPSHEAGPKTSLEEGLDTVPEVNAATLYATTLETPYEIPPEIPIVQTIKKRLGITVWRINQPEYIQ